ncbi:hypothetical protein C8R47DRAFT_1206326 [Mycena vitilis]|nr:hypothetical protein C8R47DRAFT_1206326 [Mycena vitilis]
MLPACVGVPCRARYARFGAARLLAAAPHPLHPPLARPRRSVKCADTTRSVRLPAPPDPAASCGPRTCASMRSMQRALKASFEVSGQLGAVQCGSVAYPALVPACSPLHIWRSDRLSTINVSAHILQECPRYDDHRDILRKASATIHLPDILGTKEGIAALADFIEKSGAFTKTGAPRPARTIPTFEEEPEAEEVSSDGETDDEDDDEDAA